MRADGLLVEPSKAFLAPDFQQGLQDLALQLLQVFQREVEEFPVPQAGSSTLVPQSLE